jgi:hypothetical protein
MLDLSNAFSSQIRCITPLVLPSFGGKVGRGRLPFWSAEELTSNGKEVVRVFACTTSLTFNLTKTRLESFRNEDRCEEHDEVHKKRFGSCGWGSGG